MSESNEQTIIISKKEYDRLVKRDTWLEYLERARVDKWDGIDYAYELRDQDESKEQEQTCQNKKTE